MNRIVIVTALLLASVVTTTTSAAPVFARGHGMAIGRQGNMLAGFGLGIIDAAEKLDLKNDQIARLKEIRKGAPGKLMPPAQTLMEARIAMQDLLREDDATPDALRQANQRLLDARTAMQQATFELRLAVREVLTPKQRAELKNLMQERVRTRGPAGRHRLGMQQLPPDAEDFDAEVGEEF